LARPRSKQFPEIRRAILQCAAKVFARTGYATSTIGELTEAASVSRGALYHYFPSKEALLFEVISDHILSFRGAIAAAMQSATDPVQRLHAVTAAIIECNVYSRNEQIVLLNEINQLSIEDRTKLRELGADIVHSVAELIMELDGNNKVSASNKSVYAMMYLGMVNYMFAWYRPEGPVKPRELADMATALLLNGLKQ
jgi:AcrR family transcriptional regulator